MSQFQSLVILVLACLTCFIPESARAGEGREASCQTPFAR